MSHEKQQEKEVEENKDENKDENKEEEEARGAVKSSVAKKVKLIRDKTKKCDVYSWFEITLKEINVPDQTFSCTIEMHIFWQDFNFANVFPKYKDFDFIPHDDCHPFKMSEIFENKMNINVIGDPVYKFLEDFSTIYCLVIVDCTFTERMELNRFPVDRQFLNILFNAWVSEGNWNWTLDYPDWVPSEFHKPFCVRMISSITEYELLPPWVDWEGDQPLTIRLRVNRKPAYYLGNIVFPNFLIVASTLSAFVIVPSDSSDRLSVSTTLLLAVVAFRFVIAGMLPKVSYLTLMDYYLIIGFAVMVILIGENTLNSIATIPVHIQYLVDYYCIGAFCIVWTILHLIAVAVVLSKNLFRISWEKMDEIDKQNDEDEEFIRALDQDVKGNSESEESKMMWNQLKTVSPQQRARSHELDRARGATRNHDERSAKHGQESPAIQPVPSKILDNDDNLQSQSKQAKKQNETTENQLAASIMLSSNNNNE